MASSSQGRSSASKHPAVHRLIHALLALLFVGLMVASVVAIGLFTAKHVQINTETPYGNETLGHCIYYADYNGTLIELGRSGICVYFIFGQAAVALYAIFAIAHLLIKIGRALEVLTCMLLFEFVASVLVAIHVLLLAIVSTSGLKDTCDELSRSNQAGAQTCSQYRIPDNPTGITFYSPVVVSTALTWLELGVLSAVIVFYAISLCSYFVRLVREKRNKKADDVLVMSAAAQAVED